MGDQHTFEKNKQTWVITGTGWWLSPTPLKKYESQLGLLFPSYGKIKNVPNHQPGYHLHRKKQ